MSIWDVTRQIPVVGGVQSLAEGRGVGAVVGGFSGIPGGAAIGEWIEDSLNTLTSTKASEDLAALMGEAASAYEAYRPQVAQARENAYRQTVSMMQPYGNLLAQAYGSQWVPNFDTVNANPFPEGHPAGPGYSAPQYLPEGGFNKNPVGGYAPGALSGTPYDVGTDNRFTGPAFGPDGFMPSPSSGYAPGALAGTEFEVPVQQPGPIPPPPAPYGDPGGFVGQGGHSGGPVSPWAQPEASLERLQPNAFDNPGSRPTGSTG